MVVLTAKVSKRKILTIALILVVIVGLVIALCVGSKPEKTAEAVVTDVSTNDGRVAFLKDFGWEVTAKPVETQEVKIPQELPEVLQTYNTLQQSQGFDLTQYGGKTVKRYVYEVKNYPDTTDSYFATLLVYKEDVVGGDVSSAAQNGVMQGFAFPKTS